MKQRTYLDKMRDHLEKAEEADARILQLVDNWAVKAVDHQFGDQLAAEPDPRVRKTKRKFYFKKVLEGNIWYSSAVGQRNYNVAMATMYGIAHQALKT